MLNIATIKTKDNQIAVKSFTNDMIGVLDDKFICENYIESIVNHVKGSD